MAFGLKAMGLGFCVLAGLALVSPGAVAQQGVEEEFSTLHRGISAMDQCGGGLSADEHAAAARAVDEIIGGRMGAGKRLDLLLKAKVEVGRIRGGAGCGSQAIADHLAVYKTRIAPRM